MRTYSLACSALVFLSACEGAEDAPARDAGHDTAQDASRLDAEPEAELDAQPAADTGQTSPGDDARGPAPASDASTASDAIASDASVACATPEEEKFSFFMISLKAVRRESGSAEGFGGNLGGIRGADAICQRVAESSSACQRGKVWRAFLSTTKEHAIDRIGKGPWHDRLGRLFANALPDLLHDRPMGAHAQIINDLPNEEGVPNRNPDGTGNVDNHQTLTGTGADGKLYNQSDAGRGVACGANGEAWSAEKATCWDWTSDKPEGCPHVGHSWPRQGSGLNWISIGNEGGCAPGVMLADRGGLDGTRRVGSAGGYGGFYCFAVTSP
jgi:hypothetical protein